MVPNASGLDGVVVAGTGLSEVDGEAGRLVRPASRYVGPRAAEAAAR